MSGGFDVSMQLSGKGIVHVVLHPGDNWSFDYCDDGSQFAPDHEPKEEHFASFSDAVAETRKEAQEGKDPEAAPFALVVRFDSSSGSELKVTAWARLGDGKQRILARAQLSSGESETKAVAVRFRENAPASHASSGQLQLLVRGQECVEVGVDMCVCVSYVCNLFACVCECLFVLQVCIKSCFNARWMLDRIIFVSEARII